MFMNKPVAKDNLDAKWIRIMAEQVIFSNVREAFDLGCIECQCTRDCADCNACPIQASLLQLADSGWFVLTAEDQLYVAKERASCDD